MKLYSLNIHRVLYASLLLLLFFSALSQAKAQEIGFEKTWGGRYWDVPIRMVVDQNGDIYIVGYLDSFGAGRDDAFILKYGQDGTLIWQKTWGGGNDDYGQDVAVNKDGDIYVVGYTSSFGAGGIDAFILKYGQDGTLIWQKTWGAEKTEFVGSVAIDAEENIYVVGTTTSFGAGLYDLLVLKYSPDGTLNWQKTWGLGSDDHGHDVVVNTDGEICITGCSKHFGAGDHDVLFLKYDPDGTLIWQNMWGEKGADFGHSLALDQYGDVYVVGETYSFGLGGRDAFLLKYGSDGRLIWKKLWGEQGHDIFQSVDVDQDGKIYAVGLTASFPVWADACILKYDPDGALIWQKTYGGEYQEDAQDVVTRNGLVYVVGSTFSSARTLDDVVGVDVTPGGIEMVASGVETVPSGLETVPSGVETIPSGEPGQGSRDVFLISIVEAPPITAAIDIHPDTLNLKSNGKWVTCYIELPDGYEVNKVDVGTIQLTVEGKQFSIDSGAPTSFGDYDGDSIPDLMVKFSRADISAHLGVVDYGDGSQPDGIPITFEATGRVNSELFKGSDIVCVIKPGK